MLWLRGSIRVCAPTNIIFSTNSKTITSLAFSSSIVRAIFCTTQMNDVHVFVKGYWEFERALEYYIYSPSTIKQRQRWECARCVVGKKNASKCEQMRERLTVLVTQAFFLLKSGILMSGMYLVLSFPRSVWCFLLFPLEDWERSYMKQPNKEENRFGITSESINRSARNCIKSDSFCMEWMYEYAVSESVWRK
jgi:hypothetical protein